MWPSTERHFLLKIDSQFPFEVNFYDKTLPSQGTSSKWLKLQAKKKKLQQNKSNRTEHEHSRTCSGSNFWMVRMAEIKLYFWNKHLINTFQVARFVQWDDLIAINSLNDVQKMPFVAWKLVRKPLVSLQNSATDRWRKDLLVTFRLAWPHIWDVNSPTFIN